MDSAQNTTGQPPADPTDGFTDDLPTLLGFNAVLHGILLIGAGLILDAGQTFGHVRNVVLIYWGVTTFVFLRSFKRRSRWGVLFVKYGTVFALVAHVLLYPIAVLLRGWLIGSS